MKILLVSDETDRYLWDDYQPGHLEGLDLILAAGDLKAEYLSFLVTFANCPLLYVPGNHDGEYEKNPPEGCENIDGRLVQVNGIRIAGLGGCRKYKDGPFQVTEREMRWKIRKLGFAVRKAGGVDIVLAHSPAAGYGDEPGTVHQGFDALVDMMDRWKPEYLVHGHMHFRYRAGSKRIHEHGNTTIINACGKYYLTLETE